jgi:hypothetical protein
MGAAVGDFDNDGRPDLYVTNLGSNQLLRNNGDGTFTDVTKASGTDDRAWSTSAVFVDYDEDGWLDLFVANYIDFTVDPPRRCYSRGTARDFCGPDAYKPTPDRLFRNRGDGTFEDASAGAGIRRAFGAGLGAIAGDFNQDGRLDLYVTNDGDPNLLWINQGGGRFVNQAVLAGVAVNGQGVAEAGMGVSAGDFDRDGDEDLSADLDHDGALDVLVANQRGPLLVYRNRVDPRRHWIAFELEGTRSNRSAIGATVELYWDRKAQVQTVMAASGFSAQNQRRLHYGLGRAGAVDRVVIRWPSGARQTLDRPAMDRLHRVKEAGD